MGIFGSKMNFDDILSDLRAYRKLDKQAGRERFVIVGAQVNACKTNDVFMVLRYTSTNQYRVLYKSSGKISVSNIFNLSASDSDLLFYSKVYKSFLICGGNGLHAGHTSALQDALEKAGYKMAGSDAQSKQFLCGFLAFSHKLGDPKTAAEQKCDRA